MTGDRLKHWATLFWWALNQPLIVVSDTQITVATILAVVVLALVTRRTARGAADAVAAVMKRRELGDAGTIASFSRLTSYAVMIAGGVIGAHLIGIDLGSLVAAGAVFAVGISFALQSIAQNFVSGVILLVERTIRPGDVIQVDGTLVRIQELGIRATRALTLDGVALIIPNGTLVQSNVLNYSLLRQDTRVRVLVGVAYGSDYQHVFEVLRRTAAALTQREPVIQLKNFGDSSVEFETSIWIPDAFQRDNRKSDLALAIAAAFKRENIEIAFPQLDLHIKQSIPPG